MADNDRQKGDPTEATVVPAQYQKAKQLSWPGRFYDVLDIADREERRLMYKLDAVLVTFMSAGYFLKYLDQANVNSAFVSGMKEDLNMYGNQLTTAITCWTVGYAIGQSERPFFRPSTPCR